MKSDAVENRTAVYNWFRDNPGGRGDICAKSLGLSENTVSKHRRAIAGGWRPVDTISNDLEFRSVGDLAAEIVDRISVKIEGKK